MYICKYIYIYIFVKICCPFVTTTDYIFMIEDLVILVISTKMFIQ